MFNLSTSENLTSVSDIIKQAREQGVYLGKGGPQNRLRYFIKIGLLPHMQRKRNPATGKVEGHLPISVLQTLVKIQELKNQDYKVEAIKEWFRADKIRQVQTAQAPIQQFNGLIAKITQPITSAVERLSQIQQTQAQETSGLKQALREFLTHQPQSVLLSAEARGEGGSFSRIALTGIIALIFLGVASFFLIPRVVTDPIRNEIKNLALKLNLQQGQPPTTNNYYQTTNNYNNQLPVDEKGFLKLNGISIGDGNILLDSSGNIKFLGAVTGGLIDTTSENLLLNPGFEVNSSGEPDFWDYGLVSNEGNTFVNQESVHTGKSSAKFYFNISSPMSLALSQERTKISTGRTYTLSAFVKGSKLTGGGTVRIGFGTLRITGATKFQDFHLAGDFDFKRISYTFTVPSGSTDLFPFFEARGYSSGSLYIDDAALEEGAASTLFSENSTSYLGGGSITLSSNAYLYPSGGNSGQLGQSGNRFNYIYGVTGDFDTLTAGGAVTFKNNLETEGAATISGNFKVEGQSSNFANNVILGSDGGDTISLNGYINTNLMPTATTTYDIGSSSLRWRKIWTEDADFSDAVNIGGSLTVQGTTLATTGNIETTGNLTVEGNTILGNSASDWATISGTLAINLRDNTVDALDIQQGSNNYINISTVDNTITVGGQLIATKAPTQPHTGTWTVGSGTWNADDATVYINPSSAVADSNLLGLAVGGSVKFAIDAEGDIFGKNMILEGSSSQGTTTITGDLTVEGNTILGDAPTDTLTFNASTLSIPNSFNIDSGTLYIDSLSNRVGIGTTGPEAKLDVLTAGYGLDSLIGIRGKTVATGTIGSAYGGYFEAVDASFDTITSGYGAYAHVYESSGEVQTGYGLYSECDDATTCYGLYVAAGDDDPTTDWGIYVTGEDKNYLSGNVGIGTTTPTAKLDVAGNAIFQGSVGIGTTDPEAKLEIEAAATDTTILKIDGSTNPYSGDTSVKLIETNLLIAGQSFSLDDDERWLSGINNNLDNIYDITDLTTYSEINTDAIYNSLQLYIDLESGNYDASSSIQANAALNSTLVYLDFKDTDSLGGIDLVGTSSYNGVYPTYTVANATPVNVIGTKNEVIFDPSGAQASSAVANIYGEWIKANGTTEGTQNLYGIYIDSASGGADNNYALYSAFDADSYFAGNVGIGTTGPARKLEVNGSIRMGALITGGGTAVAVYRDVNGDLADSTSSIRYKTDITNLENVLPKLMDLHAVRFKWNDQTSTPGMADFGMIAEEVSTILPDLVTYDPDGTPHGLKYEKMGLFALKGLQEQEVKLDEMGNLISSQSVRLEAATSGWQAQISQFKEEIAKLKTGLIGATEIISNTFTAKQKIISPVVETNIISPLPDSSDIVINLKHTDGTDENTDQTDSGFGKLLVKGNLEVEGQATVSALVVENDATISGTLYAEEIVTKKGTFGELLAGTVSAQYITNIYQTTEDRGQSTDGGDTENTELTDNLASPSSTLADINILSSVFGLSDVSDDLKITSDITILGHTSLAGTTIAGDLTVDASITLSASGVQTFDPSSVLRLQSSGLGGVDILAGAMTIDKSGNLNVKGTITAGGLTLKESTQIEQIGTDQTDSKFGKLLTLVNKEGQEVTSIDASGSAYFAQVLTPKIFITKPVKSVLLENQSAGSVSSEQISDSSIGSAIILPGAGSIIIKTPHVNGSSQVFLTPISPTGGRTLYIENQTEGQFTVKIEEPLDKEIKFNWFIIN